MTPNTDVGSVRNVFSVVAERQTYKNLLYLFLAFPLGFVYYMLLTFGLAFGAVFTILLVGIGLLIGTVVAARVLAGFERLLANALLDLELAEPDDIGGRSSAGLGTTIKRYLEAPSTWCGLGFLTLKFWVGIVGFILVFLLLSTIPLLTAPIHYPYEFTLFTVNSEPIAWSIDTLPEAIVAVPVGVLFAIVFLHILNAFASVNGWIATALLGNMNGSDEASAPPAN